MDDGNSCDKICEEYPLMFSSTDGEMYSGKKPKEPLEYFIIYCALNEECLKTIYFQSYYSYLIGCMFLTPYNRSSEENII